MRILAPIALVVSTLMPVVATAGPVTDAVQHLCITPLQEGTVLGEGLERAPSEMERKLLNGKIARLYRTDSPQILVVAHESGKTCEVMALGTDLSVFDGSLSAWHVGNVPFIASADSHIPATEAGGGYYVAPHSDGGFIQAFVTSRPEAKFIGVTVARVADSAMAREVLGIE